MLLLSVWDINRSQSAAVVEGILSDFCHRVGYINRSQSAAVVEGTVADFRHRVRDGNRSQSSAAVEGLFSYFCHRVRDSNRSQPAAVCEGTLSDFFYCCRNDVSPLKIPWCKYDARLLGIINPPVFKYHAIVRIITHYIT